MIYFIADLHFGQEELNKTKDKRGFNTIDELNEYMIKQWNSKVEKDDTVIVLGDFSLTNAIETNEILERLKGKKWLIIGNHDRKLLVDKKFRKDYFEVITPYEEIEVDGKYLILCHYPISTYINQFSDDTYMLHGHIHNTSDQELVDKIAEMTRRFKRYNCPVDYTPCNLINCFCMYSNYLPLTLEEWINTEKERKIVGSNELIKSRCFLK